MSSEKPVIVIAGPTASGKSETALLVAEKTNGEIVSADSMQVYRGLDIGTAKVDNASRQRIPHHLIDILDPCEPFSVADYVFLAERAIRSILDRGKQPILCGGTGQYLSAMIDGLRFAPVPACPSLRENIEREAEQLGLESLWKKLESCDPKSARRIAPQDKKRIVRALEIFYLTGKPMSWHDARSRPEKPPFSYIGFCLNHDRAVLYKRINDRVDAMLSRGLLEEVERLLNQGVSRDCTSLQAIGYKECIAYFDGKKTRDETREDIKQASRRYAKRQLTWFRHRCAFTWLQDLDPASAAEKIIECMRQTEK